VTTLPDVGRLLSMPAPLLRGLGERLRATGLGPTFAGRLARVGERLDDALRTPMRTWHARRMREPAAIAARLFLLHDPVEPSDAGAALGDLAPLLDAGVLSEVPGGFLSPLHVALAGDVFCFGDRPGTGGGAVMPICGGTLELVRASMPSVPVEGALDLGCGAGPVALLLARASRRVVATDVSARALSWTRFNAVLNGVTNVETRDGDLYEPVRGERFDRIAAHPPFVARPAGATASTFVHGGARGDELPLRVVAGAAPHLTSGGRAVVLADWPLVDGDRLDTRIRTAVGEGAVDALVLQSPSKNLDEYCALHAAVEHPDLGDSFARAAIAQRDHLDTLGLRGLALAFVVLTPGVGWTSLVSIRHVSDAPVTSAVVERLWETRSLAFGPRDALAAARLRLPTGARLVEQPMPDGTPPAIVVQLPAGRVEWPPVLEADRGALVARIAAAEQVGDDERTLQAARDALLLGALVVS
jgi:SAM-dependent methyltransferase